MEFLKTYVDNDFVKDIDNELNKLVKKYGDDKLESIEDYVYLCELMADYEDEEHFGDIDDMFCKKSIVEVLNKVKEKLGCE